MDENINLVKIGTKVRTKLNRVYKFHDSKPGFYVFNPSNPDPELLEMLRTAGMTDADIAVKLEEYNNGDVGGTCVSTPGNSGYDYIILLPPGRAPIGELAIKIGEETMHGEHATEHNKLNQYMRLFSGVAREFFGGSGTCQIARKVCKIPPGKALPDGFPVSKARYYKEIDTFQFDIAHVVGYELAREAVLGEPDWKREMFHEADERRMWRVYNEVVVPNVRITIPPALDNRDGLLRDMEKYLKSIGLKFNLGFIVDESDTRAMNR